MSATEERIRQLFGLSIEAKIIAADTLSAPIAHAAERLVKCLLSDKKILVCGSGCSAANALHFSTVMMNHFEVERPSLPVIALNSDTVFTSAVANDNNYADVFSRQIHAIGQENDLLLILTTAGNADNLLQAVNAANDRGLDIIALTGRDGGLLANHLGPEDIEIRVVAETVARIREIHLFILYSFCELIEQLLFGQS